MKVEPIIGLSAERDLAQIWKQRSRRGTDVANLILAGIYRQIDRQAQFPDTGDPCDEYLPGLRRTTVHRYIIYFRKMADTIYVVRVLHSARNLDRILKRYFGS